MYLDQSQAEALGALLSFYDRGEFRQAFGNNGGKTLGEQLETWERPSDPRLGAYYDLLIDDLGDLKLHSYTTISGEGARIFAFQAPDGSYITVFEGTQLEWGDIEADLQLGDTWPQEYIDKATDFVNKLGGEVTVVGHSLGGYEAKAVTCLCPNVVQCYAINAPAFSQKYIDDLGSRGIDPSGGGRIAEINNPNDTVHNINKPGVSDTDDILYATGALDSSHLCASLPTCWLSDTTKKRDFSEACENQLASRIGSVSEAARNEINVIDALCEILRNILENLPIIGWIVQLFSGNEDSLDQGYSRAAQEIDTIEQTAHNYFTEGREIDESLKGKTSMINARLSQRARKASALAEIEAVCLN